MTGIRVPVTRGGQDLTEELEHLTDQELRAALQQGGSLHGQLPQLVIRLVAWARDLEARLPFLLAHLTPQELGELADEYGAAAAASELWRAIVVFRGGPYDGTRRELDPDGRLHVRGRHGQDDVYERGEKYAGRFVWEYREDLSSDIP
jgi:hypothetical protein